MTYVGSNLHINGDSSYKRNKQGIWTCADLEIIHSPYHAIDDIDWYVSQYGEVTKYQLKNANLIYSFEEVDYYKDADGTYIIVEPEEECYSLIVARRVYATAGTSPLETDIMVSNAIDFDGDW